MVKPLSVFSKPDSLFANSIFLPCFRGHRLPALLCRLPSLLSSASRLSLHKSELRNGTKRRLAGRAVRAVFGLRRRMNEHFGQASSSSSSYLVISACLPCFLHPPSVSLQRQGTIYSAFQPLDCHRCPLHPVSGGVESVELHCLQKEVSGAECCPRAGTVCDGYLDHTG